MSYAYNLYSSYTFHPFDEQVGSLIGQSYLNEHVGNVSKKILTPIRVESLM